jgi:DNA-binding transcriptional LysR family regulator
MARLDLNLVRLFVAVYETGSVTSAAQRLALAQPSVSYGLARLREAYADPLFLRNARGMVPTALAEEVYGRFSQALAGIDSTLDDPHQQFDPAHSHRRFKVAMSDIGELYFVPPLLTAMRQAAPSTELEVVQMPMDQIAAELGMGRLDAAIGNLPDIRNDTRSEMLFVERYVCLLGKQHPRIRQRLSLEAFLQAKHVLVSSPSSGHRLIEQALADRGVSRQVALRVPHFTALPQLIAGSDLLVTLPSRVATLFAAQTPVRWLELPVPIPTFDVRVHWHTRQERLPAHGWFIGLITQTLRGL